MKRCSTCKTQKPVSEFHKNASKTCGLSCECRGCSAEGQSKRRKENPERIQENRRQYYQKNREKIRAQAKHSYKPNKARSRKANLKYLYGITPVEVSRMKDFQSGACAICGRVKKLVVDHNHKTDFVRELLCYGCNSALGKFGDCAKTLRAAANYLEKHEH